ncbi:MAG: hypothetical protein KGH61_01725 [Candidatus Micrarchaeota archaeon]|nr:hypothetical protein [Candidatus Micrarchaeota archaeon]MDE1847649.1 hypothetical protein [Candidatus Micrarchaeota archaeon]MDE1864470.1 hypothetical protein [Candidatus Micrarchaeota archaeon]
MKFIATQNHVDDYRELAVQYIHDQEALVRIFKNDPHPIVQENVIYNINQIDLLKDLKQFSKSPRVTTRINEKIQKLQNEADQKISEALNAFKEEATKDTPRWHVQQEMIGVVMSAATSSDQKFKILHELTDITRRMNDPHKNLLLLEIERRLEMSPEVQTFKSLEK